MRPSLLLSGLALCLPALAQAQLPGSVYRGGMPDVIVPAPPPPASSFDAASFSRAYTRAGRPAIAVLWNREFSDLLEQTRTHVERGERETQEKSAYGQGPHLGREAFSQREVHVTTRGDVKSQQPSRAGPAENIDLQMRSAFVNAIASTGVVVVDRNLVMRTLGLKKGSADAQRVEAEALSTHAKLLLEVLNTPDPASPTGWATQFSIKRFSDGAILASGYFDGRVAPPSAKRFEADPNGGGFREVRANATLAPAELGRLAAEQALGHLGQALAR